jgi:hypothetical protein
MVPLSPTFIGLAPFTSKVSPIPTRNVPFQKSATHQEQCEFRFLFGFDRIVKDGRGAFTRMQVPLAEDV